MYYFASDVHLGLKTGIDTALRERVFTKWLDEVSKDAKAIFLVGDIFDFWYEYKRVIPRGNIRLLGKLCELTDRGVEIHHFEGNHDMWTYNFLAEECGIILHHKPYEIMELYGKRVLIGHGDQLGRRGFVGNTLGCIFRSKFTRWAFSIIHPDLSLSFGNNWSKSNRDAKPVKHTFRGEEEHIVKFAREMLTKEQIDLFVCGHIHCAEIYPLNENSSIAFLGEWIENPTYGVLSEEGFILKNYPITQ